METWSICTKLIDGKEVIIKGGKDLVVTDNYYRTMRVEEVVARQIRKLEIVDGELLITEPLLTLDALNRIRDEEDEASRVLEVEDDEQVIITPVNMKLIEPAE